MPTVKERLRVLEDIEEIRKLKARYCAAREGSHNPETPGPLFAEAAMWEASGVGRAEGRDAIKAAARRTRRHDSRFRSPRDQPDHRGRRRHRHGSLAADHAVRGVSCRQSLKYRRIIGWYREKYARIAGRWHFQHLYCEVEEHAPYALEAVLDSTGSRS